jgi:hypothetical protein
VRRALIRRAGKRASAATQPLAEVVFLSSQAHAITFTPMIFQAWDLGIWAHITYPAKIRTGPKTQFALRWPYKRSVALRRRR